jgi:hypothetical protein
VDTPPPGTYTINLDDKFGSMTLIDIPGEIAAHEPWFNQTLTTVNDSVVRLGIIEGDFHWHSHEAEDEFFLVLEGELLLVGELDAVLRPLLQHRLDVGEAHEPALSFRLFGHALTPSSWRRR